jgi:uncharacterized membrane protein YgcG
MSSSHVTISGVLLLSLSLVSGCGDARDTSDPLGDIAASYRQAIRNHPAIPTNEAPPNTADTLRSLARQASSASRDGNEMAAAMLSSGIHAKAGAISLSETLRVQSSLDISLNEISSIVSDALLLEAAAVSRENLDLSASRDALDTIESKARGGLTESQNELDELRAPIESALDTRGARRERAAELDTEAASLARRGLDAGPLDGEALIKESIDLRLQAHGKRIDAAREDITLIDLEPAQRISTEARSGFERVLDAARTSEQMLDDRQAAATAYAQDVHDEIDSIARRLDPILQQLATEQTQVILPGFQAAVTDFEASSTAARRATRGGSPEQSTDAWLGVASGELGAGRAQWAMAGSLHSQTTLLSTLLASGDLLGDSGRWQRALEAAQTARQGAVTAAKTSYEAALQSLSQVRGLDLQTNAIRESVTTAISALDGADLISMATSRRDTATPASTRGGSPAQRATPAANIDRSAPGFASPSEVVALMSAPPADLVSLEHALASARANSPAATSILDLANDFVEAIRPASVASMEKFGKVGSDNPFGVISDTLSFDESSSTITIEDVTGDTATLTKEDQEQPLILTRVNGRWFIDVDSMLPTGEAAQMIPMLGMMFTPMIAEIKEASTSVAAQIRAGEFETADDASAAFSELVSDILSNVLGGFMGGDEGGGEGGGGFPGGGGGFPGGGFPSGG